MGGLSYGGAKHSTPVYRCSKGRTRGCGSPPVITARLLEDRARELVVDRLRGLELEAVAEDVDLAAVDRDLDEAEAELRAFATDLGARRSLGEALWQETLGMRVKDRNAKRQRREDAHARSRLITVAQDVENLDHDALRDLLLGMVRHVSVLSLAMASGPTANSSRCGGQAARSPSAGDRSR